MPKIDLSMTTIGQETNLKNYAKESAKFLIEYSDSIIIKKENGINLLNTSNLLMKTIVSELYNQAIAEEKLDTFTLLNLSKVSSIPSWFLITWLDLDVLAVKQLDPQSYSAISSIGEYRDQILFDITGHIDRSKTVLKDRSGLQNRVIRDLLCRNYLTFDTMWLSPVLLYHLTKIYSLILANKLGRLYNLSYQEMYTAATVIGVFFTNRCGDIKGVINPIMHKMDFFQHVINTKEVFAHISSKYTEKDFDVKAMVDTIRELGPSRMNSLNQSTFFNMNTTLAGTQIVSLINLEYPPYFTASVLGALSGDKSSSYHSIKNLNLHKDSDAIIKEILKTNSFIRSTF